MKRNTMIAIGAIAALGIGAWYLLKDKGGLISGAMGAAGGAIAAVPGQALMAGGAAPETIRETGVPGGVGDILYNLVYGGDLRAESTKPGGKYYEAAKLEIPRVTGVTPTPEMIVPRAVALGSSTKIHDLGLPGSLLVAPVTIGAGMGAITQQARYREALPTEEAKQAALVQEYETRQTFIQEHPVESLIGFPALIAHAVTTPTPQTDFFSTMARGWGRIFG